MNITTETLNSGLTFNRFPGEVLQLPYSQDEIKIQPNDTVSSDVINLKLKHLHENFLYLFSNSKICSNLIPVSSSAIMGLSAGENQNSNNLTWKRGLSSSQFVPATGIYLSAFNAAKCIYAVANTELPIYNFFISDGQTVILYFSTDDDVNLTRNPVLFTVFNPTPIGVPENNVRFKDVVSIAEGPDDTALILDKGANTLYQYEIRGLRYDDNVFSKRVFFKNLIGEFGTAQEKLSFNAPVDVVTYNNEVYVLDAGNNCIKKYDQNLNWLNTYLLNRDFLTYKPQKLKVDQNGNFYCLLSANRFYVYSNEFQNKQEIVIDYLNANETVIDLAFSKTDKDIYYVVTNENIYKGLVNNLGNTIGKYLFYLFKYDNPQVISAFASVNYGNNDKNLILSYNPNSNAQILGSFIDNKNLYDNLTISDFDIYSLDDILIKPEEYVQSWVVNKAISKLIANHLRFIDQIIGKFQFKYDSRGNSIFQFTRYLTAKEKQQLTQEAIDIL